MAAVETNPAAELEGTGEHTLPASWWTSPEIFELEKRAIFFKSWLFTTHTSRFKKAGDYHSYTVAGLSFFLIKNKSGEIKAFHNVCRHRAYPVIKKEQGSSIVLGCKYHGWSYNTDGQLTKAPQFENVAGFDKSQNGLYQIHTHITDQGLIFINFDSSEEGPTPFDEWYVKIEDAMKEFDFSDYEYHMSYELDGQFNWKTLMDGYQECYHCPVAHPELSKAFKIPTYAVEPKGLWCRHHAKLVDPNGDGEKQQQQQQDSKAETNRGGKFDGLWMYLFPNNGVNCYSPAWYSIRVLPITATRTILQYDIYKKKGANKEDVDDFVDFLQTVEKQDFDLCEATQTNLNTGVYSTGVLHPTKENGVLYYQAQVKQMIMKHLEQEKKAGRKVNPAFVGSKSASETGRMLDKICQDLECGAQPDPVLAW